MNIHDAIHQSLVEQGLPIVMEYDLFRLVWKLHGAAEYKGKKLRIGKSLPTRDRYRKIVGKLLSERYLRADPDFYPPQEWGASTYNYAMVFRISDLPDAPAEEITALLDPFCYVSHLSAMQRYGLTERIPEALTLSTPKKWNVVRDAKIQADYRTVDADQYIAPLKQLTWPEVIRKRPVTLHKTIREPAIKTIRGSQARIAAVGETFVQMLDRPELCGGMEHIIDVWDNHAKTYLEEIIKAVDHADESIIKVRAGYLMEERLGIQDSRVLAWLTFAQRGGSRKLDPRAPYVPKYSQKWMISLNVGNTEPSA